MVLVVLWEDGRHSIGDQIFTFVRNSRSGAEEVYGFTDPQVGATLKAIQDSRKGEEEHTRANPLPAWRLDRINRIHPTSGYWSTHGAIFAEVKAIASPKAGEKLKTLVLRPKLTFAGAFDAGKTPEVTVPADLGKFGPKKEPAAGDKVLIVLQREGDSYRVAQEKPAYMPETAGARAPLCVVKDFSDPKVGQLVKSLKAVRKAERDNKSKVEPGGQRK
jgi:hypothetical protein